MANRRFVRQGGKRRPTNWQGSLVDFANITVGTAQAATIVTEAILEGHPNPTIVRIRGELLCSADAGASDLSFGEVIVGMMLVDDKALAAGIASLQTPATDIGSDWIYWDCFTIGSGASGSVELSDIATNRHVVDSKAMRKVGSNQALIMVVEVNTCEGTTIANLCGAVRILLKDA